MALSDQQIFAANQGSIIAANNANAKAGLVPAAAQGSGAFITPPAPAAPTGGAQAGANPALAGTPGYDVFGNKAVSAQLPGSPGGTPQLPTQTPKPTTAVSSDQGAQYAAENTQKLQTLKNTGLTVGQDGLARYSDQSFATAPADAVQTENGTWQSGGVQYALGPATSMDPELQAMNDKITTMKTQFDSTSRAMIDNIKSQFDSLIKQQTDTNTRGQASLDQSLLMGGSSRYAQQSSAGQSTAMVSYGLNQLADLNTKEQTAVLNAQSAMDSGDMKFADQQLQLAQEARKDKQAAAAKLSDALVTANKALQAKQAQVSQEQAVGGILSQGITDPSQIQDMMNKYQDGTSTGANMSLDDINKVIANLNPDAKDVHQVMLDAAKAGASPDILKAIGASKDVAGAINAAGTSLVDPSSTYGQYLAYSQKAQGLGQAPVSYQDWSDANKAKADAAAAKLSASSAYNNAYNAAKGKAAGTPATTGTPNADGTTSYTPLEISRYTLGANRIVSNFLKMPQYELTAQAAPYLERIQAASQVPGSVSDEDLLDSLVKLNTGGNAVTSEQVQLITGGKSFADSANVWSKKLQNGGVLSDNQRTQILNLANSVYDKYKQSYQPVYDQATKQLKAAGVPEAFWTIPDLNKFSADSTGGSAGDKLIQNETTATNTLQGYIKANPAKSDEINQRIQTMEKQTGKPVNAADFLQVFPEYGQQAPAKSGGIAQTLFPNAPIFANQ